METQTSSTGGYTRFHVFLFSMAYLWTMLTLDVVYSLLLVHGFVRNCFAARRERRESRRFSRPEPAVIPVASFGMQDDRMSGTNAGMDSDLEQAA